MAEWNSNAGFINQLPVSATGGSMGLRYILLSEKSQIANTSATTEAREEKEHRSGILRILEVHSI